MPNRNGTGPTGKGKPGRGLGPCGKPAASGKKRPCGRRRRVAGAVANDASGPNRPQRQSKQNTKPNK